MLSRAVSGSYLAGTAVSAAVFALSGALELVFALAALAVSAALLPLLGKAPASRPPEESARDSKAELARSTIYLAVFSFVFGAVGQAGADADAAIFPTATVALVALPLVAEPPSRDLSVLLLFVTFFLAGLNARVTVCQLSWATPARAGTVACFSLGIGGLAMLAGVTQECFCCRPSCSNLVSMRLTRQPVARPGT